MISEKMVKAINEQIKHELESSYLYLSMAAYFHDESYDGMAKWMKSQAQEELGHAMKFFQHLQERDGRIELFELARPQKEWKSPKEAFKAAYEHEKFITRKIHDLAALAESEKDYASSIMLQWFITEQVEEEANASQVVQWFERMGDTGHGMVMLDVQLGKRE
ncbi:MAG: ferritin [Calditrichaeota bacterium]|nr:ferritin [Calditrichota bacterium]